MEPTPWRWRGFWPKASIHAFEPVPAASNYVKTRAASFHPRVVCHSFDLAAYDGEIPMHVSGDGSCGDCQSSSMLPPSANQLPEFPDVRLENTITVPMIALDSWARREGIDRIDFLWLDMQGYRLRALAGASHVMENGTSGSHGGQQAAVLRGRRSLPLSHAPYGILWIPAGCGGHLS